MAQLIQTQGRQQGQEAAHCPKGDMSQGRTKSSTALSLGVQRHLQANSAIWPTRQLEVLVPCPCN